MAALAKRIRVKSIEFGTPPFRKLESLKIDFADRFTLIAGHNGIGKSTILGLLTNTFGITEALPKSYFGDSFYTNIERIVYLALDEVDKVQEDIAAAPVVVATVGNVAIQKRCAMTRRAKWKRARVVPRTVERADDDEVGQDAKIPLPTIYLGMKRLASIGEADEGEVTTSTLEMDPEDSHVMLQFVTSVIIGIQVNSNVTHQSIKGSKKRTLQPGYDLHDAQAISMGQDSLSSIATAIASFNRLKREQGEDYAGGLLVIDELDVGFHPHAIGRLAQALKTAAKRLDLQIVATTHSPRLIEAIHPEGDGNEKCPDRVVYLLDTNAPRMADDQSLAAILNDMALKDDDIPQTSVKPVLGVYFEDLEGSQFCSALVSTALKTRLGKAYNVRIKFIPLGVGGSNLIGLPDKDPIFRERVLIVDADTAIPQKAAKRGNTIKLPCARGASGTARSPENTIKGFLRKLANPQEQSHRDALRQFDLKNVSSDRIRSTYFASDSGESDQRDSSKGWWTNHWAKLERWGVLKVWAQHHSEEVAAFLEEFERAVASTARKMG